MFVHVNYLILFFIQKIKFNLQVLTDLYSECLGEICFSWSLGFDKYTSNLQVLRSYIRSVKVRFVSVGVWQSTKTHLPQWTT